MYNAFYNTKGDEKVTLGDVIKKYREENGLSQREFAKMTGLSNSYISQLEMNTNSKNGQPIKPQLETFKAVADAMHTSIDVLFSKVDDMDISIKSPVAEGNGLDDKIMNLVYQLPDDLKESLYDLLQVAVLGARKR